ncbi:MAG: HYR domain-containing protein, partial [Planctomycetes bacterium]|nr:HYR domain-containing protein [Planctomycetota bacterium]
MNTKSARLVLCASCLWLMASAASASVTTTVDILDAGDGIANLPPSNVVVADVLVDVSDDDTWTASGVAGLAMNGATLRYGTSLDPNNPVGPILTNPGTGQRFVTFFSKPRGRDADGRYTNGAAAAAGKYSPTGPTPVATTGEINVAFFASPPETAMSPSVDGAIFRVALDLPAGVTNSQVLLYTGSAPAGATVLFASAGSMGDIGTVSASFDVPTVSGLDWGLYIIGGPPANDACSAPTMFSCGGTPMSVTEDTRNATLDPSDPVLCSGLAEAKTVWFSFTADCARTATIDTIGTNYDTVLAVWTGTCGSLTSVACNDDIDQGAGNLQSSVTFGTVGGTTYLVEVADFDVGLDGDTGNTGGDLVLNFVCLDTTAPVITCPGDVTVECTGGLTPVTFTATATDACDGPVTVTCTPPSGTGFRLGSTPVSCTATDSSQNSATCTFNVIVEDTMAPTMTCPDDITGVECTSPSGAVVNYIAGAMDQCGIASFDCAPPSGSTFPITTTTVTCTATDRAGNTASCSFSVTVVDTTPPMITCPANQTLECTSPAGAVATFTTTATDVCDATPTIVCTPPSGSTFGFGPTTVNCTATDDSGNSSPCSFTVTVRDTTAPSITCPANQTSECTSSQGALVSYPSPTATDTCDSTLPIVCNPASGSQFAIATTTVYCTATDDHQNTGRCNFTVTVRDTVGPTIHCPSNIRAVCSGDPLGTIVEYVATATDLCDLSVSPTCVPESGSHFPLGQSTVNCSATDDSHNTSRCSFRVTIVGSTSSDLTTTVVGQPASALIFPLFQAGPGQGTIITVTNLNQSRFT